MRLHSISAVNWASKRVLVRVDFNVPLRDGQVADASRIAAAVPTIAFLLEQGAQVVLCSHLGRPQGVDPALSLAPVAPVLERLLNGDPQVERAGPNLQEQLELASAGGMHAEVVSHGIAKLAALGVERLHVRALPDCVGGEIAALIGAAGPGEVFLLENLRFHPEEEANDPEFARQLAALADSYVSDAFGTVHRAHASTVGVAQLLPAAAGFLVQKEVEALAAVANEPQQPLVIVMGGAKISDKLEVLENLLPRAQTVLIGGAMANTFLAAQGFGTGLSLIERDMFDTARRLLELADRSGTMLLLPVDVVVTDSLSEPTHSPIVLAHEIDINDIAVDIGPKTREQYSEALQGARTVFWNGPMGVFEQEAFSYGTLHIAKALAGLQETAFTVVGGGESVEAVNRARVAHRIGHLSTGGGASLEFVAGRELPGLAVLEERGEAT